MKQIIPLVFISWFFLNTWPGSKVSTEIGPFRSLTQCNIFSEVQRKSGARVSRCIQNGETLTVGWWLIANGGGPLQPGGLSLTAGPFLDQAACELFRTDLNATKDDTASACFPSN